LWLYLNFSVARPKIILSQRPVILSQAKRVVQDLLESSHKKWCSVTVFYLEGILHFAQDDDRWSLPSD
jgi:hypothetical protein